MKFLGIPRCSLGFLWIPLGSLAFSFVPQDSLGFLGVPWGSIDSFGAPLGSLEFLSHAGSVGLNEYSVLLQKKIQKKILPKEKQESSTEIQLKLIKKKFVLGE